MTNCKNVKINRLVRFNFKQCSFVVMPLYDISDFTVYGDRSAGSAVTNITE